MSKGKLATITRVKKYPTPGTNYRVAWKYLYSVSIDGGNSVAIDTRLDVTVSWAKARAEQVKKAWEA